MFCVLHQFVFSTFSLPSPSSSLKLPSDDDDDNDDDDNNDGDDEDDDDDGVACSRLRDSGEKSFSEKKCEKTRGGWRETGLSPIFSNFSGRHHPLSQVARVLFSPWHRLMMVMLMISFSDQSPFQYEACVRNGKLHRNDDGLHNIVSSGGRYW